MSFNLRDKVKGDAALAGVSTRELAERFRVAIVHPDYLNRIEVVEVPGGAEVSDAAIEDHIAVFESGEVEKLTPEGGFDDDDEGR